MQESQQPTDEEVTTKMKQFWDNITDCWTKSVAYDTLQSSAIAYDLSNAKDSDTICETGAGCGDSAFFFINNFMKPGARYYISDFSPEMVKMIGKRFNASLLADNPKVKFTQLKESDRIEVSTSIGDEDTRYVYSTVANSEKLPYTDEVFDTYISIFCLNIANSPKTMLAEALRVTKKGGTAVFGTHIPVLKQGYNFLIVDAIIKNGLELPEFIKMEEGLADPETIKAEIEGAGFSKCRVVTAPLYFATKMEDAFDFNVKYFGDALKDLPKEKKDKLRETYFELWNENFGEKSPTIPVLDTFFAFAQK